MNDRPRFHTAAFRLVALGFILMSACIGCARTKIVEIITSPPGATIYVDGEERGLTPGTIKVNFTSNEEYRVLIQLVKDGCHPVVQPWSFDEVPKSDKWVVKLTSD